MPGGGGCVPWARKDERGRRIRARGKSESTPSQVSRYCARIGRAQKKCVRRVPRAARRAPFRGCRVQLGNRDGGTAPEHAAKGEGDGDVCEKKQKDTRVYDDWFTVDVDGLTEIARQHL
jgi:hypothetical protein